MPSPNPQTIPSSPTLNAPTPSTLHIRDAAPPATTKPSSEDGPIPKLGESATLALVLGIVGIILVALTGWYFHHRSKQRRTEARRSREAKWDPAPASTTPSPIRSWVDVDVEARGAGDVSRAAGARTGNLRAAPKWDAVAERVLQHERGKTRGSVAAGVGAQGPLSGPPPVFARRETGGGDDVSDASRRGTYVAMLWAPGQQPAPPRASVAPPREYS